MAAKKSSTKNNDMTMKLVIFGALAFAFAGGYLVARAVYKPQLINLANMVAEKDVKMQKMKADANRIIMKDGKMWMVENGMVSLMDSDIVLPNGTKVTSMGKITMENGEESMMKNGDAIDMEGKYMQNGGADVNTSPTF